NLLYVSEALGIGVLDVNGNEIWTLPSLANAVAVDKSGRFIVSNYDTGSNLFCYSITGVLVFADSTVIADRITTDQENNILLLTDDPEYTLVKYDSTGNFQWLRNTFPARPPFGYFSFEV